MSLTPNAQAFVTANAKSPVVEGWVLEPDPHRPARGGTYVLKNGSRFTMNVEECRTVTPRWDLGD